MNINITVAGCCLVFAVLLPAFQITLQEPPPVVTVDVHEQKYCLGDPGVLSPEHQPPDSITLRLHAAADYRNIGKTPLILPVRQELSGLIVSRSVAEVKNGRNQLVIRFPHRLRRVGELPPDVSAADPFNPLFTIIPPGEGLERKFGEYVVLTVHSPSSRKSQPELLGQKIFVQLVFCF